MDGTIANSAPTMVILIMAIVTTDIITITIIITTTIILHQDIHLQVMTHEGDPATIMNHRGEMYQGGKSPLTIQEAGETIIIMDQTRQEIIFQQEAQLI
jgi:hypothetical protein